MEFVSILAEADLTQLNGLIEFLYNIIDIIKIVIPLALIILGSLDLGKAVMAGEEKEIKESQKILLKRAIAAIAIFFVASIVTMVIKMVGGEVVGEEGFDEAATTINLVV